MNNQPMSASRLTRLLALGQAPAGVPPKPSVRTPLEGDSPGPTPLAAGHLLAAPPLPAPIY